MQVVLEEQATLDVEALVAETEATVETDVLEEAELEDMELF